MFVFVSLSWFLLLLLLPFLPFIDCLSSFSLMSHIYLCLLNVDVNEASFMIFFSLNLPFCLLLLLCVS